MVLTLFFRRGIPFTLGNWDIHTLLGGAEMIFVRLCVRAWPANMMRNFIVILVSVLALAPALGYPETDSLPETLFRFHAPDAKSVEVIGDFNAWLPGSNFLHGPNQQGLWQAVIALPAGTRRLEYIYLVNGQQRFLDPAQPVVGDDFGGENNVWLIP